MTSYRMKLPKILWGPSFASTLNVGYPLDAVTAGSEPRDGSAFDQAVSGVEDAWITGTDYKLTADIRWIPQTSSTSPLATGWDDGFRAFLEYARQKNVIRFYPDAAGTVFVDCYLVDPMQGYGMSEPDGSRKLTLTLRVAPFPTSAFYSLTVGDGSWAPTGTPTRTAGAFVCADGTVLDLIGDDSATVQEYYTKALTFTGDGVKAMRFRMARSSAYAAFAVHIYDSVAAVNRLDDNIDFTAASPVVTPISGSVVSVTNMGDGSFDVLANTTAVVAANAHLITVYGSAGAGADIAQWYIGAISVYDSVVGLDSFPGY